MTTYTLEPGRVVAIDGKPALRIALHVDKHGDCPIGLVDADALARRFVCLLNWREAMERGKISIAD